MEKLNALIDSIKITKNDILVFMVNFILIFTMVVLQHMHLQEPTFVSKVMSIVGLK